MSSPKEKRVHYERGTKGGRSGHRSSRDSGIGSSSASDRASLGTSLDDTPFSRQQIENQKYQLGAVQEALNAAYEKIKYLQEDKKMLNESLAESNKENRQLKKERMELMNTIDYMTEEKRSREKSRREGSLRSGNSSTSLSSRTERASPPRRLDEMDTRQQRRTEDGSQTSGRRTIRRESVHERLPTVPQAPYNSSPNPFTPASSRSSSGTYIVPIQPQSPVAYIPAPAPLPAPAPATYTSPPTGNHTNDGRYHAYPL